MTTEIMERRIDAGMVTRDMLVVPTSWNAEQRTIDVVWTTGARGARFDWTRWEFIDEELSTEKSAVRLDRLNSGAPVLNTHLRYELSNQIGVVVPGSARMESGQGVATLQLSAREDVAPIAADIAAGIIRNISVGYRVHTYEITERDGQRALYRAIDWEPSEISFVPVPFDAGAQTRSDSAAQGGFPCTLRRNPALERNDIMNDATSQAGGAAASAAEIVTPPAPGADAVRSGAPAQAPANQISRFTATDALRFMEDARHWGGDGLAARAQEIIAQNERGDVSVETANRTLLNLAAEARRADTSAIRGTSRVEVARDEQETTRGLIVGAMVARAMGRAPEEGSRQYMGHSLLDLARVRAGVSSQERDPDIIMRAAHSTSDFPIIMEQTGQRILLERYQAASPTFTAIARRRNLRDFRPTNLLRVGDFPTLLPYLEDGEIKSGTIGESKEQVQLASFGRRLALTRQVLVNDDIGAFDEVFGSIGTMIAQFENATFYTVKSQNGGNGPKLADGKAVFHADHGNLAGSGGSMSIPLISAGRASIRKQKNSAGQVMNWSPKTMLVGPDTETLAEQLTSPLVPQQAGNVNPFSGKLDIVAEGSIPDYSWELYADPNVAPVWVYGSLESAPSPKLMTKESWSTDGMAFRVTYDFYVDAIDYRGAYRNPGAAPA